MIRTLVATAMATPLAAFAQREVNATIGWLAVGPIPSNLAVFREALRRRGYVEGQNLILQERYAGTEEQYRQQVSELIRLRVDVLVTTGGVASRAAKLATRKIPIVFLTTDPVGGGLVTSLARPTENLTGLALLTQDFNAKRVETILGMVPQIAKLAALNDASGSLNPSTQRAFWEESEAAARRFGVQLAPRVEARSIDDVDGAFATAVKAGAGAMLTVSSSYFNTQKTGLVSAAVRARLPTIYEHRDFVEAGGLVSYGPDLRNAFNLAASYVDRILKGAQPADLPVEQVSKVELVINQGTARTLQLAIPQALLLRADEVIP
jgi:putative ABC transport system substrate-binding protein